MHLIETHGPLGPAHGCCWGLEYMTTQTFEMLAQNPCCCSKSEAKEQSNSIFK